MSVISSFFDCLARSGYLYDTHDIIYKYEKQKKSKSCQEMWLSLFNGCKIYKNPIFISDVIKQIKDRFTSVSLHRSIAYC